MTISGIAKQTIDSLNLIPAKHTVINGVIDADWNGVARILLSEGGTRPENACQFGIMTLTTVLNLYVLSGNRAEALELRDKVGTAVLSTFERLAEPPGRSDRLRSSIFCSIAFIRFFSIFSIHS